MVRGQKKDDVNLTSCLISVGNHVHMGQSSISGKNVILS